MLCIAGLGHELQVHGNGERRLGLQVRHQVRHGGVVGQIHVLLVDGHIHDGGTEQGCLSVELHGKIEARGQG
ncbi:hypothetical protein SDC9_210190 [bioreactor metagenome]|uniref:Uncharacterized protein n=1 Tax=bioreactor metagenome TaxID=1076179 RepID=A0A645JGU7_9ZZZZ